MAELRDSMNEQRKSCPLQRAIDKDQHEILLTPCESDCAWFDENRQQCVMMVIARALREGRR